MKRNFLVVAADAGVREGLAGDLRAQGYSVTRAPTGAAAETIVGSVAVDAVLIESHLPDVAPDKLRARLLELRPECRVVILTNFGRVRNTPEQLSFGAGDYLLPADEVLQLVQAPFNAVKEGSGDAFARRGHDALIHVVDVLVGLLELDDRFFGGFSHQVMRLARSLAQEMSADEETVTEVVIATLLRDIGKIDLEPDLLSEEGWYSQEQRQRMNAHVDGTLRLFEHIDFPWKVLPIIRHHHERYDGRGYPDGIRGREIPLGARIVAVVDAFVALTSGRTHRGAFDPEQALTMLTVEAGRQFDPEVVEALQNVLDKRRSVTRGEEKPRISLVNAQDDFRTVIKMALVNEGFEVVEPESLEQALERLPQDPSDLVLADLDRERDQVFRFLREVREDPTLCAVPVAFLSHHTDRSLRVRALREGVDDFLSKGTDLQEIVARVQNIVVREVVRRDGKIPRMRRGITGDLENLGLAEIVQTLVVGMKTARVSLRSKQRKGQIWFENGNVRHAAVDDLEGEDAFYEMVRWDTGRFVIEHGVRAKQQTLKHDGMYLIMEGLRRMDESGAAKSGTA